MSKRLKITGVVHEHRIARFDEVSTTQINGADNAMDHQDLLGISFDPGFGQMSRDIDPQARVTLGTAVTAHQLRGAQLCCAARPPDPKLVGERWREMWLNRLRTQPFPLANWLKHPCRDESWRHGSVCED